MRNGCLSKHKFGMLVCNNYNRQAWVGLSKTLTYSHPSVMIFENKGTNITSAKRMFSKVSGKASRRFVDSSTAQAPRPRCPVRGLWARWRRRRSARSWRCWSRRCRSGGRPPPPRASPSSWVWRTRPSRRPRVRRTSVPALRSVGLFQSEQIRTIMSSLTLIYYTLFWFWKLPRVIKG